MLVSSRLRCRRRSASPVSQQHRKRRFVQRRLLRSRLECKQSGTQRQANRERGRDPRERKPDQPVLPLRRRLQRHRERCIDAEPWHTRSREAPNEHEEAPSPACVVLSPASPDARAAPAREATMPSAIASSMNAKMSVNAVRGDAGHRERRAKADQRDTDSPICAVKPRKTRRAGDRPSPAAKKDAEHDHRRADRNERRFGGGKSRASA